MEHYCQWERYFSVFYDVQTPSVGPTQFSVKCIFGFFFTDVKHRDVKLRTHTLLGSRLRMSGAVPLSTYVFMSWAGTSLYLPK